MAEAIKQKVRTHWRLPAAIQPEAWLRLTLRERPARNCLGAVVIFSGELAIAAWIGRQVHVYPLDAAARSLRASIEPEERVVLDDWLSRAAAGEFEREIERERERNAAALW